MRVGRSTTDHKGVIWIGTENGGLNTFDPITGIFTHYRHDPGNPNSLSHNNVSSIYEDQKGKLWFGTWGGGINQFDRVKNIFTHYKHEPTNPYSLSHNNISSIYEDKAGMLWITTNGGGLNYFNRVNGIFTHYKHDPNNSNSLSYNRVRSLFEDKTSVFWIATLSGLDKFNRSKDVFFKYKHDPDNPNSLSQNNIGSIYEDQKGRLWVGTWGGGLNQIDRVNNIFTHYKHDPANPNSLSHDDVLSIYGDKTGVLWIGTVNGLNKLDPEKKTFTRYHPIPNNQEDFGFNKINTIYEDRNGVLWIGTWGGITKFNRKLGKFAEFFVKKAEYNPALLNSIESLKRDNRLIASILKVGDMEDQIRIFKLREETKVLIFSLGESSSDLQFWDYGWIENEDGENIWKMDYGKTKYAGGSESNIIQYELFALEPGKYKLRYRSNERHSYKKWIGKGAPDKPELWGVQLFSITEKEEISIKENLNKSIKQNSISNNIITQIYEDKSGFLWIGTLGGGLNQFDRITGTFKHYTNNPGNQNGLSHNKSLFDP